MFSCERVLYKGTAPEQKTKSAKIPENSMFSGILIIDISYGFCARSVEDAAPYKICLKKHLRGYALSLQSERVGDANPFIISFLHHPS